VRTANSGIFLWSPSRRPPTTIDTAGRGDDQQP
jgi:hypothetical protein